MPRRPRLLLIDDEADFRETIRARLIADGFEVLTAASGPEGIEALSRQTADLILLDMLMPGQGGIATYQEIRAVPSLRQIPIILLTGVAPQGHWERMPFETDELAYIMGKPYELAVLLDRITHVLAEANRRAEEEGRDSPDGGGRTGT